MEACPAFDPLGPIVTSLVSYVDCQGLAIGQAGYDALGPGSAFGVAFTGLLTIYIALVGYRLLLGAAVSVRGVVWTAARLGVILALVTQWPAYRVLIFDVATQVPEAVAARIANSTASGEQGTAAIARRFDIVLTVLNEVAAAKSQLKPLQSSQVPPISASVDAKLGETQALQKLQWTPSILSVTALTGLLSVRILIALLLASGPLFIICALFEWTMSLWLGWLRVLAGTFFGALAVPVLLSLELSVVERQASALRDLLSSAQASAALTGSLLVTSAFFAIVLLAVLGSALRVGLAVQFPQGTGNAHRNAHWLPAPSDQKLSGSWANGSFDSDYAALGRVRNAAEVPMTIDMQARRIEGPSSRGIQSVTEPSATGPAFQPTSMVYLGQQGRRSTPRAKAATQRRDDLK